MCDGTMNGIRYFDCPNGKGFFTPLVLCRKDSRFLDSIDENQGPKKKNGKFYQRNHQNGWLDSSVGCMLLCELERAVFDSRSEHLGIFRVSKNWEGSLNSGPV